MSRSLNGRKILILGAGAWQTPYIKRAKELGLTVFATDWKETAHGARIAHCFKAIDLRDRESSLAFAADNGVEAVFTAADIGVTTAAYIGERLNLRFHTMEVALSATNKALMRAKAQAIGLGVPRYVTAKTSDDAFASAGTIGFPMVIKPVDSCSSRGVFVVSDMEELQKRCPETVNASFSGEMIMEELMTGVEGSVEALVRNGKPLVLGICDKQKSPLPYRYDLQLNYPGAYSKDQYALINQFIDKLVAGFEIQNGIIHVEIMTAIDSVRLIEFSVRGCGSNVITHLIPGMTGFDVMEYLLFDAFGITKEIARTKDLFGALKFIMLKAGRVESITGLEEARKIPGVLEANIEREAGDLIGEIKDGRSRPGYMLAVAQSREELRSILEMAERKVSVSYF